MVKRNLLNVNNNINRAKEKVYALTKIGKDYVNNLILSIYKKIMKLIKYRKNRK